MRLRHSTSTTSRRSVGVLALRRHHRVDVGRRSADIDDQHVADAVDAQRPVGEHLDAGEHRVGCRGPHQRRRSRPRRDRPLPPMTWPMKTSRIASPGRVADRAARSPAARCRRDRRDLPAVAQQRRQPRRGTSTLPGDHDGHLQVRLAPAPRRCAAGPRRCRRRCRRPAARRPAASSSSSADAARRRAGPLATCTTRAPADSPTRWPASAVTPARSRRRPAAARRRHSSRPASARRRRQAPARPGRRRYPSMTSRADRGRAATPSRAARRGRRSTRAALVNVEPTSTQTTWPRPASSGPTRQPSAWRGRRAGRRRPRCRPRGAPGRRAPPAASRRPTRGSSGPGARSATRRRPSDSPRVNSSARLQTVDRLRPRRRRPGTTPCRRTPASAWPRSRGPGGRAAPGRAPR